ncbi:MAG: CPBP family intramembrane glutamic endopeptidase [Candidatus Heimdallarchaeaceae archaeon]|jgi:membrane protease YdiL (CAAX protease family)
MTELHNLEEVDKQKILSPTIMFFLLSFLITWSLSFLFIYPLQFIYQMRSFDSFIGVLCYIAVGLQSFGPTFAAIITISYYQGKEGLKDFGKRLIRFKVKFYWYLLVFFLPVIVYSIPIIATLIVGNPNNYSYFDVSSWGINFSVIIINIVFAGLAEEPGWRGFAVPEMNKKQQPIVTGIIVGVFWAVWHLLAYIYGGRPWSTFPQFIFTVTIISCIYVWIYMRTESIPLMIIFHVMHNLSNRVFIQYHKPIWGGLIYLLILIVIVILDRPFLLNKPIQLESKEDVNS